MKKRSVNIILIAVLIVGLVMFYLGASGTAGRLIRPNTLFYGDYVYADFSPTTATVSQDESVTFYVDLVDPNGGVFVTPVLYEWYVDDSFYGSVNGGDSESYTIFLTQPGSHEVRVDITATIYPVLYTDSIQAYAAVYVEVPTPTPTPTPTSTPIPGEGTLSGTVTNTADGTPISDAWVQPSREGVLSGAYTVTDSDGKYSMNLVAATYHVQISKSGTSVDFEDVVITAGQTTTLDAELPLTSPTPTPTPIPQVSLTLGAYLPTSGKTNPSSGTHYYTVNTNVIISATAYSGFTFSYWLYDDYSKTYNATTTLTMSRSRTALAVFTQNQPSPSPTPSPSPLPTPSGSPFPSPTPTPVPTATPEPTPIPTPEPTEPPYTPPDRTDEVLAVGGLALSFISALSLVLYNIGFFKKQ